MENYSLKATNNSPAIRFDAPGQENLVKFCPQSLILEQGNQLTKSDLLFENQIVTGQMG